MQVSAISLNNNGYNLTNNTKDYRFYGRIEDTSFNSLAPSKSVSAENLPIVIDSINQWKKFCHKRILGEKLNIIA